VCGAIFPEKVTSSDKHDQGIAVSVVRQACNRLITVFSRAMKKKGCATSFSFGQTLKHVHKFGIYTF
jgi:hypothetical protein